MNCPKCNTQMAISRGLKHKPKSGQSFEPHICAVCVCHDGENCKWGKWMCELTKDEKDKIDTSKSSLPGGIDV